MLILNDTHTEARTAARRADRFKARHTLWSESSLPRVRSCGRAKQRNDLGVMLRVKTDGGSRRAGWGNVQHCGSVWSCSVCSATISAHRQTDIEKALTAWYSGAGTEYGDWGRVALVTLTMRHHKGQSLASLWDALAGSWNLAASGAGWAADQLAHGELVFGAVYKRGKRKGLPRVKGSIPIIRVVEVTEGGNGWHVHVHALLLLPSSATDQTVAALGASMWGRWLAALEDRGLDCDREHGVDARLFHGDPTAALGQYFTKATYQGSMEVARGDMKSANHGNRTPFALLADIVTNGDADDLDTWHEYERASKGRRQIAWSHGLRARLLPADEAVELTDEEILDLDAGGDDVAELNADLWAVIVKRRADYKVLRAFEVSDADGYALLWELAWEAQVAGARQWARLLRESDPLRRRWQTKDAGT